MLQYRNKEILGANDLIVKDYTRQAGAINSNTRHNPLISGDNSLFVADDIIPNQNLNDTQNIIFENLKKGDELSNNTRMGEFNGIDFNAPQRSLKDELAIRQQPQITPEIPAEAKPTSFTKEEIQQILAKQKRNMPLENSLFIRYYNRLAENNPNRYGQFLDGWLNRIKRS